MKKYIIIIPCLILLVVFGSNFYKRKNVPVLIHKNVIINNNVKKAALAKKKTNTEEKVLLTLEIPKINLKKDIYYIDSKKNSVDYNIEVLKESTLPGKGVSHLFFASHRGNSKVSFFEYLYKLERDDIVKVYYNDTLYVYKISHYFITDKDGTITVNLDESKDSICLITCDKEKKDKQIVYIGYKI